MPLLSDQSIKDKTRLLVWNITEDTNWLLSQVILNDEENKLFKTFGHEARKNQWLTIRLLLQIYFQGKSNHHIQYTQDGKPHLNDADLHISVSHSHQLAGIIISSDLEVGLDIERLGHKIERIKHKFLSKQELQMLKAGQQNEQLHVLWCGKEVMYKIYGKRKIEFDEHLNIDAFDFGDEGTLTGQLRKEGEEHFDIFYHKFNDCIIAWGYRKINV